VSSPGGRMFPAARLVFIRFLQPARPQRITHRRANPVNAGQVSVQPRGAPARARCAAGAAGPLGVAESPTLVPLRRAGLREDKRHLGERPPRRPP
jgi:hypothetical protein